MDIDWPEDFGRWLDRLEAEARAGDERSRLLFDVHRPRFGSVASSHGSASPGRGDRDPAMGSAVAALSAVAVSHGYDARAAVRLICWFPPGTGTVVVALFAADKAKLGDVFYDGVATRTDPMIDQWKRETAYEEKP